VKRVEEGQKCARATKREKAPGGQTYESPLGRPREESLPSSPQIAPDPPGSPEEGRIGSEGTDARKALAPSAQEGRDADNRNEGRR